MLPAVLLTRSKNLLEQIWFLILAVQSWLQCIEKAGSASIKHIKKILKEVFMEIKKTVTKLTLEDIPKVGSPFRKMLIDKLTELDIYKKLREINTAVGFSTAELNAIEEKYKRQEGLLNEDIQNEINKKGWLIKPTTIKQYIQKEHLPMPIKRRKVKGKGAVSLYPRNFMRHLNFVRFLLNAGRDICMSILSDISSPPTSNKTSDHDYLKKISDCSESSSYDSIFEAVLCRLWTAKQEDIANTLGDLEDAESLIDGTNDTVDATMTDEQRKRFTDEQIEMFNDRRKEQRKIFENLKKTVQNNNNFDNALKLRTKSYILRMKEIEYSIEAIIKKIESIEAETKNALWT